MMKNATKTPSKKDGPFDYVLHSLTVGTNVHHTVKWINEKLPELIPCVMSIDYGKADYSTVLLRGPATLFERLKAEGRL